MIIFNKHGIHELPHELPNDLTTLENQEKSGKSHNYIELLPSAQSFFRSENFQPVLAKTF